MESISLLGLLGVCSIMDISKRKISSAVVYGFGILGIIWHIAFQRLELRSIAGGMLIGIVLYVISVISHEKIGKGDAILFIVTGIYLGFWNNIWLLWSASVIVALYGLAFVFIHYRIKQEKIETESVKETKLPFVPFVMVSFLFCLWKWGGILV